MADHPSQELPRKKPSIMWWLFGAFLVLAILFFYQLFGPNPAIIVSPQTTYITTPLRPDGLPDYEKYMLDLYRDGVTPENNAAVLLWQAMWPGDLEPEDYDALLDELGLDEIPAAEQAMQPLYGEDNQGAILAWLAKDGFAVDETGDVDHYEVISRAISRPWTAEQCPPLANWLDANGQAIDLLMQGSHRPKYYSPSPTLLNQQHDMLLMMLLPDAQATRNAAQSLAIRAMKNLGEQRLEDAWTDLLAIHRWARLASQSHGLVEQFVAMAVGSIACDGTIALLANDQMTDELARRIQSELASLPHFHRVAECINHSDRLQSLDAAIHLKLYGLGDDADSTFGQLSWVVSATFDWSVVLQGLNYWYDRLGEAMQHATRATRQAAYAQIEADMLASTEEMKQPSRMIGIVVARKARSAALATLFADLMMPAVASATTAEDRANTVFDQTRLAAALAVYRAIHDEYPGSLTDLAPDILDALPVDVYHGQPFLYRRTNDGYLLYSAGENGRDDGGSHAQWEIFEGSRRDDLNLDDAERDNRRQQIPAGADDISIRVPRPAFELPRLQLSE